MVKTIRYTVLLGAFLLAFSANASAQSDSPSTGVSRAVNGTAKVGVVVIGSAAKYSWKATKFTASKVAKPIVVKAAPAVGKFALKQSGSALKKSVPLFKKFAVTYLKFRFSP